MSHSTAVPRTRSSGKLIGLRTPDFSLLSRVVRGSWALSSPSLLRSLHHDHLCFMSPHRGTSKSPQISSFLCPSSFLVDRLPPPLIPLLPTGIILCSFFDDRRPVVVEVQNDEEWEIVVWPGKISYSSNFIFFSSFTLFSRNVLNRLSQSVRQAQQPPNGPRTGCCVLIRGRCGRSSFLCRSLVLLPPPPQVFTARHPI